MKDKLKQVSRTKVVGHVANSKREQYMRVIDTNKLRKTNERLIDFRSTLKEIIDMKNGIKPSDQEMELS